jgi:signal transduction histidine kinase
LGDTVLDAGSLQFSVDARILRELGERLVRRPETALLELIKNSYDADATLCRVVVEARRWLEVVDDGHGMTLEEFRDGWMRIGTASKAARTSTVLYRRPITGEKGIGRFSVRFLGERLKLTSVADDPARAVRTTLTATFNWPEYDESADIGRIDVPYQLTASDDAVATGTSLRISKLRPAVRSLDLKHVRTGSIGLVSPLRSLMALTHTDASGTADPGFRLVLGEGDDGDDIAARVLDAFELRATLEVTRGRLHLMIYAKGRAQPYFELTDTVSSRCGDVRADIRFFPRRAGAFRGLGIDGRRAYTWIRENAGVAVFDRDFRVAPYGDAGDDWLRLSGDAASNRRQPRARLALKHFPMSESEQSSTSENWMLRLPQSSQLVGVVQVSGARDDNARAKTEGLVAAADREGFIANDAFDDLFDLIRGSVEALAMADRRRQRESDETARRIQLRLLQDQAAAAAREVEANKNLPTAEKRRLLQAITQMATSAEAHERLTRERLQQLEVMSLLGVVAGYMTHEFGVALDELDKSQRIVTELAETSPELKASADRLQTARDRLSEFLDYSSAYIRGARQVPSKPYPALPRVRHVRGTFERYAAERGVTVETEIRREVLAPLVPTALYDGIILNLLTNALKATTALTDRDADRTIAFRAWNEKDWHYLEAVDTGIGVPSVLRERVFDPLFTTTESNDDPLGSGMGLGLALVKASVEAFGGTVAVTDPPPGFTTCIRVRLPLSRAESR